MDRTAVEELVYQSCLLLDDRNYKGYLDLCSEQFRYTITAHSPEIRKDMIWLDKDRKGMKDLFDLLPKQNMDRTPLTRHFSLFLVERGSSDDRVKVTSARPSAACREAFWMIMSTEMFFSDSAPKTSATMPGLFSTPTMCTRASFLS